MSEVQRKDLTAYTDFLPIQFSESPNIKKLLSIFLAQAQELEDANMDLDASSTDISIAEGYQLDIIGKLIGRLRQGQTDIQYRDSILFQISINVGNGTPEDCIQYLASVTKATKVQYWEHYPASVILETNGAILPSNIPNTLDNITMAGVSVGGVIAVPESGQVFRGCSENEAFSNYESIIAPYPELESGGDNIECGNILAECSIITFLGFTPVQDDTLLARCILPPIVDLYAPTLNGAGEGVMACGEEEAACSSEFTGPLTTKGVFAGIYTKI